VPIISPEELRERLSRDLPGALPAPPSSPESNGAEEAPAEGEGQESKKGEQTGPALPAPTNDTIVEAGRLGDVATYMRDKLGYAYLSDIAAVDYLEAGFFELVYLFYHPEGGSSLVVKARVPRDAPDVPSLTPFWPGANFVEREAYDLYGINFIGHPYLKRIYMWDELEGYPMRKDFPKQGDKYLDEA
jgi:NADH-quinone oxidoreductase subunit C